MKEVQMTSRDEIRSKVLATRKPKTKIVNFFGSEVEIRQPTLGAIIDAQSEERKTGVARMLVMYAYVPGTDEKIFTDEDTDGLLALPFGADFIRVTKALDELSEVNFTGTNQNSDEAPSSSSDTGSLMN